MERSLYPSELAAPTMKPMEPHVASRTKYWAKLLTLPSHKKKLELCRFWWLYSIFGFCYAFLFLLFLAFVSFVFPQIWLWGLRFENLDWPPARRSCCFPFLFSQSFFKSPMQKHGRKLWFLDPQRSLQNLPNTFSNFISIIRDQKSVSITPSSSTTGLCRSPRCLPRIPLTTSIMGGQLKLKPFVFGFYKFCLGTPPKLTYPQKMIVGSGRLFSFQNGPMSIFRGYMMTMKNTSLYVTFLLGNSASWPSQAGPLTTSIVSGKGISWVWCKIIDPQNRDG